MLYNPFNKDSNKFKAVNIPSNRKMFERFGFSLKQSGHPDNTDPTHFGDVSSMNGSVMQNMGAAMRAATFEANAPSDDLPADTPDESTRVDSNEGDAPKE